MAKVYKVWIEIEEFDEDTGESCDHDLPFAATGEFDTIEAAESFATEMHETFDNRVYVGGQTS